jgi:hypothetical protein
MRSDTQVIHSDDIGEVVGSFYGVPINSLYSLASELRELDDAQVRARAGLGTEPVPAEIMAGEVAKDNLIRRETTAEVVGEKFYAEEIPKGRQVPIDVIRSAEIPGVLITWRPNNLDIAVIHEEENG